MINLLKNFFVLFMFFIPTLGFIITPNDLVIEGENRTINQLPKFDLENKEYFGKLINFFNDRLLFKNYINQNLYAIYKDYFDDFDFNKGQFSLKGQNGWMFGGDILAQVYSQHTTDIRINFKDLNKKIAKMKPLKEATNVPFYLVVGPDKHGIYPEYMNKFISTPGKNRHFNKLKPYFEEAGFKVIDNYDVLRNSKDPTNKNSLYLADDTHWNLKGAYVAFNYTMSQVLDDFKPLNQKFEFTKHLNGDLIRNIKNPSKDILDNATAIECKAYEVKEVDLNSNSTKFRTLENLRNAPPCEYGKRYLNDNAIDQRKIMIICDSYGISFLPNCVEYFKEVVFKTRYHLNVNQMVDEIRKEKPDLILFINVERLLVY